jgi:hypothetical protein
VSGGTASTPASSLFRHGDPLDAADAFVRHALEGDGWEGRDNYPGCPERSNWVERGVGEDCERFIEQPLDDYESARLEVLLSVARVYHQALQRIAEQQPGTLATIEHNGFVFDSIGREPGNWQHLAFTIYTDLCQVDLIARSAIKEAEGGS